MSNRFNIPGPLIWITVLACVAPSLLNWAGFDFGTRIHFSDLGAVQHLPYSEQEKQLQLLLSGRFIHVMLVCFSIPIAFLTVVLAFVDYSIKKDVSIPIVGVALFCAGLLDTFHILVATDLISLGEDQGMISQFTWVISRTFQALILILGTGIFLTMSPKGEKDAASHADNFVFYISSIFVLLTFLTVNILLSLRSVPDIYYPDRFLSRPFDLIPTGLYVISGIFVFPAFYRKYPTRFSQTLLLSLLPAIFTELHMSRSTYPLFDNHFNIAHFLQIITYLIPFIGLSLNYLETHRNERAVIRTLDLEIRERLLAEELIKGVFNSSLNGILAFRALRTEDDRIGDFQLLAYNRSSRDILTKEFVLEEGHTLSGMMAEILPQDYFFTLVQIVQDGTTSSWEHFAVKIGKWLSFSVARFGDGLVMTFGDVSSRKRAEQDLITSEKMALTGRFARTIAHEIRNPLTNITLSIGQLKSDLENGEDDLDLYFDIVRRNCERINQLITELLNSTKPEDLNFMQYPVTQLLEETLALAADRIKLKEIFLEKQFAHEISSILVDPEKMKIALLNIIINAVEAMEPGKGRLHLQTVERDDRLVISVRDNGSGIRKENLEKLFEPFYTGKPKGTGLGLTSAQNIIHNHKGKIGVESVPGMGTEFQVSFELRNDLRNGL